MDVQVFEKNLKLSEMQRESIERRLTFALGRFASKIRGLTVSLSDINGPRGGNDKLCRLRMCLQDNGEIVMSDNHSSIDVAISSLADRAAHTVQRLMDRRRTYRNRGTVIKTAPVGHE